MTPFHGPTNGRLVRQPSVDLQGSYGVRVFSLNNLDQFFEWNEELERGMSDNHKAYIEEAYPTWDKPATEDLNFEK